MAAAVVTGAGSGLGRATTLHLAAAGAEVLAVDRDEAALERVLADAADTPGRVLTIGCDVTREDDVVRYATMAQQQLGPVDGFFNNAGTAGVRKPIVDLAVEEWDAVMALNVRAVMLGLKHVLPLLRRPGGGVVNTSSTLGLVADAGRADYVASKHAVIGLTKVAALEVAAEGVRVNCICPGPIDTPMMAEHERWMGGDQDEARHVIEHGIPMQRYGSPAEIAELVAFLILGEVRYLTGAAISVDGGFLAR